MALLKEIETDGGVALSYHRVASVNTITNECNLIEVASYSSAAKREEERTAIKAGRSIREDMPQEERDALTERMVHNVFICTKVHEAKYVPDMSVADAYRWLKRLPEFEGAEDA